MARIRTIKPEFLSDARLAPLGSHTRFVFMSLILLSDDAGRLVDNVRSLDGQVFPETDESCSDALKKLAKEKRILRYQVSGGERYIQIVNWNKHQKISHPSKYVFPAPPEDSQTISGDPLEDRVKDAGESPDPTPDHGSPTIDPQPPTAQGDRGGGAEGFEEFWITYDKKTDRQGCLALWKSKRLSLKREAIMAALSWQLTSPRWTRDGGSYKPDPIRYLRHDRWDDDRSAYGPWPEAPPMAATVEGPKEPILSLKHFLMLRMRGHLAHYDADSVAKFEAEARASPEEVAELEAQLGGGMPQKETG